MRIKFINLGCKVNLNETENLKRACHQEGYEIVSEGDPADLIVINSCSVTHISDRKTRQKISQAKREEALVAVMGCYVDLHEEIMVDLLIPNNSKDQALELIKELVGEGPRQNEEFVYDKTRAFLKVQDGCNQFCSYCIIPYARGRARSYSFERIKKELISYLDEGFKEIVLTGINLSFYGKDTLSSLGELLTEIKPILGDNRLRLGSLEPHVISEDFLRTCMDLPGFCPHFHLSLQSGSDSVLERMNRHYSTKDFKERVDLIRSFLPLAAITTDIIVGFPEETEKEFNETMDFVRDIGFSHIHVFAYSPRQGTAAAKQIDLHPEVKKRRSKLLRKLAKENKEKYLDLFINKEVEVLFEENSSGLSREYIHCYSQTKKENNSLEELKVLKAENDRLIV
ncbi:MAG TPA: tRNA (N(6)-L-threonylcarbamoyladenosine(37)-C(2))-methylthiotransferase MtaB [Clostridia bacterium]|nr:tRNA (N(6)-L-threonylcarbamoyladenosine(37)-C(2))-methylthiotransferase MtaB [Clostridia bacterium]